MRPTVTVVIVTYQAEHMIRRNLASLWAADEPPEQIVVVENASPDGTAAVLRELEGSPGLDVVYSARNLGFCAGVNLGLARARGELVLLLNDDALLPADALTRLRNHALRYPNASAFAFRILVGGGPDETAGEIDAAGIRLDPFLRPRDRFRGLPDRSEVRDPAWVLAGSGAAIAWRRSVASRLALLDGGGFLDPAFFMDKEDTDVGWRANLLGARVLYAPDLVAYHLGGWLGTQAAPGTERRSATWRGRVKRSSIPRFRREHTYRNRFAMLVKNASLAEVRWSRLPLLLVYELAALAYVVAREPFLLRSYAAAVRRLPAWLRQRQRIRSSATRDGRAFVARLLREGAIPVAGTSS